MSRPVKLEDLIDEMKCQFEAYTLYFSKKMGRILTVWNEEYIADEAGDCKSHLDTGEAKTGIAADILKNEADYIKLPSQTDINEDHIMEQFCMSRKNKKERDLLLAVVNGNHAYRRFKDTLNKLKLADDWNEFRYEVYKKIAVNWCHKNKIDFIE